VSIIEVELGRARVTMSVRADMCNGLGMCHGGVLFTLADCALEYASNSHDRVTVASSLSVDLIRPAATGDRLTATCEERYRGRSTGTYDIQVDDAEGRTVALVRAHVHEVGGPVLPPP
jgi:phenylacetic acid degradation protein PaaD